jgi:hypothetical protein
MSRLEDRGEDCNELRDFQQEIRGLRKGEWVRFFEFDQIKQTKMLTVLTKDLE